MPLLNVYRRRRVFFVIRCPLNAGLLRECLVGGVVYVGVVYVIFLVGFQRVVVYLAHCHVD